MSENENSKSDSKMGRPVKYFDWEHFDKLAQLQCTIEEFAAFFECSKSTIERRVREKFDSTFDAHYAIKRGLGKISLRRAQWKKALDDGDTRMLIHLGEQYLGQTKKVDNEHEIVGLVFVDPTEEIEEDEHTHDEEVPKVSE